MLKKGKFKHSRATKDNTKFSVFPGIGYIQSASVQAFVAFASSPPPQNPLCLSLSRLESGIFLQHHITRYSVLYRYIYIYIYHIRSSRWLPELALAPLSSKLALLAGGSAANKLRVGGVASLAGSLSYGVLSRRAAPGRASHGVWPPPV